MLQKIKATEKIVKMIEVDNLLVFEVDKKFSKDIIKKEVESLFNVKVKNVRTLIRANKKIAYIRLKPEYQAIDIATKLGVM